MNPPRFTIDGSDALESFLGELCDRVQTGVRSIIPGDQLDAVLLGGGYGRGEGGVLRTPSGDRPYNDLESFVFVRGNAILAERKFRGPLHELGEQLSVGTGLDVEFKVLTLDRLRGSPTTMFYYDLVLGHRCLVGDDSMLSGCDHHRDASRIPLHEAVRLLMNRCSGLLFARERLEREPFGTAEADFVGRNLAKAQLAFGDVVLTAAGQYHWSCRERHERLKRLVAGPAPAPSSRGLPVSGPDAVIPGSELVSHHADGVRFKLHPVQSAESREALASRHQSLVSLGRKLWLVLEERRLGVPFATPAAYADWTGNKCPETRALRNRLITLRAFGPAAALGGRGGHHPRERLFNALSRLLWVPADVRPLSALQRELRTDAAEFAGLVAAYGHLWGRFN